MSMEDRFHAAVSVIRSLPKNGSYQPSHDMMLRFYSYFKQATEGKCTGKRPAFWDVVGRAKFDAWKRLGDMPNIKAMECYVDELKKIVETMSYTDNVANFYGSINELENVKLEDLALIAPETIQKQQSDPNSPIHSRNQSRLNSRDASPIPNRISRSSLTDTSDDDEYIDTVEDDFPPTLNESKKSKSKDTTTLQNGDVHYNHFKNPVKDVDQSVVTHLVQLNNQMKADLEQMNKKLNILEKKILKNRQRSPWWSIWHADASPLWLTFNFVWPIIICAIVLNRQNRNRR